MNVIIKDYLRSYTKTITEDEILLLKTIFHKYNKVPFELTITADEFMPCEKDNYKRLAVATNNLYKKYVNFHDPDYGFQVRWLQKIEVNLQLKAVNIQWSDNLFKHLDTLKLVLKQC